MLRTSGVTVVCLVVLAVMPVFAAQPVLDSDLTMFADLVGKQWEGHFEDADESMTLYMNWELILDGAALQMSGSSSTSDMIRRNIYYFDRSTSEVAYLAMTSNWYVATGTVHAEDSTLVFAGRQVFPDGTVHDTESRWAFLSDGNVRVMGGHTILYTPVDSK